MSDSEAGSPHERPIITPSEFVQIVRGIASSDVRGRFLDAYNDPTSELHEVLLGMEEWSRGLPGEGGHRELHLKGQQKQFVERLELVEKFIRQKHSEHGLTDTEFERIFIARGENEPEPSARQAMATIARIARALDERHPELHQELVEEIRRREVSQNR